MEIVSPLSFLLAACTPLSSSSGLGLRIPTIMDIERLAALPTARIVLVGLYFCHYLNRSIISTWYVQSLIYCALSLTIEYDIGGTQGEPGCISASL